MVSTAIVPPMNVNANQFSGIAALVVAQNARKAEAQEASARLFTERCKAANDFAHASFGCLWAEIEPFAAPVAAEPTRDGQGVETHQVVDMPGYARWYVNCISRPIPHEQRIVASLIDGCARMETSDVFSTNDIAEFFATAQRIGAQIAEQEQKAAAKTAEKAEREKAWEETRARQKADEEAAASAYTTEYAAFWVKWQAVKDANEAKIVDVQIQLAGPARTLRTYTLEYALYADGGEALETRTVVVLSDEPENAYWQVLSSCPGGFEFTRFHHLVRITQNPVWHILDAEVKPFAKSFYLNGFVDASDEYDPIRYSPFFHSRETIEQMLGQIAFEPQPTPPTEPGILGYDHVRLIQSNVERGFEEARYGKNG